LLLRHGDDGEWKTDEGAEPPDSDGISTAAK
jgi:hypothetical protein